jgi:hypothetical protein
MCVYLQSPAEEALWIWLESTVYSHKVSLKMYSNHLLLLFIACPSPVLSLTQKPLSSQEGRKYHNPLPLNDFKVLVEKTLDHFHVPGISIAVVDGDSIYARGFGISNFPDARATADTLWYTGSTTKSFVAAALSIVMEETSNPSSPLSWKSEVSSIIPKDFAVPDEHTTLHATLEDLASHRKGMPRHDSSYGVQNFTIHDTI